MRLANKVALISGGARGMGAVEARLFTQEGAKVCIADILEEQGRALAAEIADAGGDAMFVRLDVNSEREWAEAVDAAVSAYGRLDILVNNAGIGSTNVGGLNAPRIHETERRRCGIRMLMDVNGKGVFHGPKSRHTRYAYRRRRLHHQHILHRRAWWASTAGSGAGSAITPAPKAPSACSPKPTAVQYAADGIRCQLRPPRLRLTPP